MSQIIKAPAKESSAKLLIAGLLFLSFIRRSEEHLMRRLAVWSI